MNTGHASTAYFGFLAGHERISDALADPDVAAAVERVLGETSALIVAKHDFTEEEQAGYRAAILERFRNPELPDTVERVGRQPLRKLGRHERFIGPAAELASMGLPVGGLLAAVGAALRFDVPADPESVELRSCSAPASQPRSCTRSRASARGIRSSPASSTLVAGAQQPSGRALAAASAGSTGEARPISPIVDPWCSARLLRHARRAIVG